MGTSDDPDFVIPAKARIQLRRWIPAFAGMTKLPVATEFLRIQLRPNAKANS